MVEPPQIELFATEEKLTATLTTSICNTSKYLFQRQIFRPSRRARIKGKVPPVISKRIDAIVFFI